jgi:hypothetical protein
MVSLLTGPLCGWPKGRVLAVRNRRSPGGLSDRLITAFEDITDVALFYYVGHGQIDMDDQLCLSLVTSRTEANRREATSLRFQAVRRALLDSPATTKIVILDCCFAGLVNRPANTLAALPDDVLDKTAGAGAYTMAASGAYTNAWFETGADIAKPQTFFTKYLADLVETGIPGEAPDLRLHPLFIRVRDKLSSDRLPVPSERSIDAARDFVFARNAAPPETHQDPDAERRLLTQRLSEAEARRVKERAEAKAQEQALRARAAELTKELGRLKEQALHNQSMDSPQQRELRDAIDETGRRLEETTAAQMRAHENVVPFRGSGADPADGRRRTVDRLRVLDGHLAEIVDRSEEQPRMVDEFILSTTGSGTDAEGVITNIYRIMKTAVYAEDSFLQGSDVGESLNDQKGEFTGLYRSALRHLETYRLMLQRQRRDDSEWIRTNYPALLEERDACIAAISDFRTLFSAMLWTLSSYDDEPPRADPSDLQRAPKPSAGQVAAQGQRVRHENVVPFRGSGADPADGRSRTVRELRVLDRHLAEMVDRSEEQPRMVDEFILGASGNGPDAEGLITDIYRIMKTEVYAEDSFLQGSDVGESLNDQKGEFTGLYRSALRHLETYGLMLQRQRRDDSEWIRKNYPALLEERDACIAAISDFRTLFSAMLWTLSSYDDP